MEDLHVPVPDHSAPSQSQLDIIVGVVKDALQRGDRVAVSCFAGIGRSGTVLTCVLLSLCYSVDEAVREVRRTRHWAWETADQHQAIITFAKRMGKS